MLQHDLSSNRFRVCYAAPRSGVGGVSDDQASRVVSQSWLGNPKGQDAYLTAIEQRVGSEALRAGIRLSASSIVTMASAQSEFPVTVTNNLGDTVTVRVGAQSDNPVRIQVASSREVTIRPGDSETVPLGVTASGNGVVTTRVHVQSLDRRRLTPDVAITVEATNLGAVGWGITIVSGIVLLASTAWRIRQVRGHSKGSIVHG